MLHKYLMKKIVSILLLLLIIINLCAIDLSLFNDYNFYINTYNKIV